MRNAALTLAATCLLLPLLAQGARLVPVYTVDVAERGGTALQNAMRSALVRATGRREAADDPALAAVVADAAKYVKDWDTGARGQPQVLFDAAALERAVTAAGRSLWDPMRPLTLVVLDPPRPRAAADAARAQLDRVAAERGLPIGLVTLPLVDGSGKALSRDALLAAAQAAGGDQLLVGRGAADAAALEWTLYTPTATAVPGWTGPLAAGIDHTVDVLAPQPSGTMALPESTVHLRIEAVNTLTDYATVTRLLQATPGLRRVGVSLVSGSSATFDVGVRGGAAGLEPLLAAQPRFTRVGSAVYRYVPAAPAAAPPTP